MQHRAAIALALSFLWTPTCFAEAAPATAPAVPPAAVAPAEAAANNVAVLPKLEPYRTFVTIQRYVIESNGEPSNPISNVRITVTFPNGSKIDLPEAGQYWPIGNGQAQEINRTFEVPWSQVAQKDGFKFQIQMERKGTKMLPCDFEVVQLSQFNRAYNCQTDVAWQTQQKKPAEKIDKEGIQLRVFTSKNSLPKEIPTDALVLK